jgi:hypothetical protein
MRSIAPPGAAETIWNRGARQPAALVFRHRRGALILVDLDPRSPASRRGDPFATCPTGHVRRASLTAGAPLGTLTAMTEGTKGLRAVRLWDTWGRALAGCGGDLAALLADASPRIVAKKPATRLCLRLARPPQHGQLRFELRVDFAGAPRAELEFDGVTHPQSAVFPDDASGEWSSVRFGGKYVEFQHVHESVPRLMDAVYARSTFMPPLPALGDIARIVSLATAVDVALGSAQQIRFECHYGKDEGPAFERMGFERTDARGAPYTEDDLDRWLDRHGPNAGWPRGVAWRRDDDIIDGDTASFGASAKRLFPH